ncbi:MAG: hypothetical protein CVV51_00630 [Spirochaetae bacterium HGW-Spirochaetae-7]|jgi:hypothetical protein|nr:MAG: hypothetical protein CVV51_00630 [Spirochaetae bacterium HGW-Spirochaetae-7]
MAFTLTLALASASCGRSTPATAGEPAPAGFEVPAGQALVLVVGDDGTLVPWTADLADDPGRMAVPFPVARSAAAIQPLGDIAVLAVNRTGLSRLSVRRGTGAGRSGTRLSVEALPGAEGEFAGRTVSSSWARGNEALFLLFRHPIYETEVPRSPASVTVTATASSASILAPGVGGDAYALYPSSADSWLVQYRSEAGDRVIPGYARYSPDGASGSGATEPLERLAFEKLVSPMPLGAAPEALRTAAAALGGSLLVEARFTDGSRRAYVRGDPGEAAPAWAQLAASGTGDGIAAIVVTDDWRVSTTRQSADGCVTTVQTPAAPVPGARARDAAIVGGLVIILWEEDLFPDVGLSGIMAMQTGL